MFPIKLRSNQPTLVFGVLRRLTKMPVEKRKCQLIDEVNVNSFFLLMTKKPNKYARRHKIESDIDRLFGDKKGLVIERANFGWTPEELDVAKSKGYKIN